MKRMYIAAGILLVILAATLVNTHVLKDRVETLTAPLEQAQKRMDAGDRDGAIRLTQQSQEQWDKWAPYFHVVLRHNNTDEVEVCYHEALAYAQSEEDGGEYDVANKSLIAKIELLYEMEQLNLKNLF